MTDAVSPRTSARIPANVYARPFGEEIVLLDFARGEYFGLDEVGAAVWRSLESGKTVGETVDLLVDRYDVAREVAFDDIVAIVTHLAAESLLLLA
ncbi:MAG: hypothetical protein JWP97_6392 [Labilithrix sp.]|nr:hypothetical protein [Labilithrix sp.]